MHGTGSTVEGIKHTPFDTAHTAYCMDGMDRQVDWGKHVAFPAGMCMRLVWTCGDTMAVGEDIVQPADCVFALCSLDCCLKVGPAVVYHGQGDACSRGAQARWVLLRGSRR